MGQPRLITIRDREATLGYVAIDSTVNGAARGGLRLMPGVSGEELQKLARAMTLKYGLLGLPQGGAKGGVLGSPELPLADRRRLLLRFARQARPLLLRRAYVPDADMGTTGADIRWMLRQAGVPAEARGWENNDSGLYTAAGVFHAAGAAARVLGFHLPGSRVVIEGFGKVGAALGVMMAGAGARVVGISTSAGAIYNEAGLEAGALVALAREKGSAVVLEYREAERLPKEQLKFVPADIFCPCALHDSVDEAGAQRLPARVVACGANHPLSGQTERILWARGVIAVPDFLANCGGVLGGTMEFAGWRRGEILDFFRERFGRRVDFFLGESLRSGRPLREVCEEYALARFHRVKERAEKPGLGGRCFAAALAFYRKGWLPRRLSARLSRDYFAARLG